VGHETRGQTKHMTFGLRIYIMKIMHTAPKSESEINELTCINTIRWICTEHNKAVAYYDKDM
jgi:hypothetical protein